MKLRNLVLRIAYGCLALIFTILIWKIFFESITTIFNVTVQTERVSFTTVDNNNSRYVLYGAEIATDQESIYVDFDGTFELAPNVKVTIDRIAEGIILITIEGERNQPIGVLYNDIDEQVYRASHFLEIIIPNIKTRAELGESFVFDISGNITLGRSVDFETLDGSTAILRGGEVTITSKSWLANSFFEAGTKTLYLGDMLVFEKQLGKAYGFVVVNENPAMEAAYRVRAKTAKVVKPGPKDDETGYTISASLLDRFLNDKFFLGLSVLFGTLLVLFSILTFAMDTITFYKETQ